MKFVEKTYTIGVGPKHIRTQILSILPTVGKADKIIVFIPGNPGLIHFYRSLFYDLLGRLSGGFGVIGLSQAGHCGGKKSTDARLETQVNHKADFFDLLLKHPLIFGLSPSCDKQIIVVTHSLGAYLGIKSLSRVSDINVSRFIGLFPTIQHLKLGIPFAVRLSARPVVRHGLAGLVHVLPKQISNTMLSWYCGESEEAKYLLKEKVLHYRLVNNVLALAWDEIKDIKQVDQECHHFLNNHSDRISLIFGHKDPYVPLRFFQEMQDNYPEVEMELAPTAVPHDFVFEHNRVIAELVAEKIEVNPHYS